MQDELKLTTKAAVAWFANSADLCKQERLSAVLPAAVNEQEKDVSSVLAVLQL